MLTSRRIWFAEDRQGAAEGRLPLLDNGVIVRFRLGSASEDLTVKLRPCDQDQLVGRFSDAFEAGPFTYRIEEDWSRSGRVLAASLARDCPPGTLGDAVKQGADAAAAMDAVQDQFLHACAPSVRLDGLVALGPVLATKIEDVPLDDLKADLEVWSVTGLEFLEVSIRVKPKDQDDRETFTARAERKQRKLQEALRERGVPLSEHPENKTRRVLTALVAAAGRLA
ncbi:hypothetical protein [Streptomyces sviceus]|uniref:hypothetical protein n=1 Tax=Streptomyces sviceus TaxID=285530 RepID=UPI00332BD206